MMLFSLFCAINVPVSYSGETADRGCNWVNVGSLMSAFWGQFVLGGVPPDLKMKEINKTILK